VMVAERLLVDCIMTKLKLSVLGVNVSMSLS